MSENMSFADFVKDSREKKKNQALAQEIFGRKSGAGSIQNTRNSPQTTAQKPSLLSRMSGNGIVKRSSSAKPNIDGKWKHDLHTLNNPDGPPRKALNRTVSASQLDRNTRKFDKAVRSHLQNNAQPAQTAGFSIRGVAATGPYTVVASNFAPGTTAHDIEMVMAPHGPGIISCRLVTSVPTVVAEMVFEEKDSADNVIATFNNKKADGRLLYVYMKETVMPSASIAHSRPSGGVLRSSYDDMDMDMDSPRGRNNGFQDGRYGFRENSGINAPRGPRRR